MDLASDGVLAQGTLVDAGLPVFLRALCSIQASDNRTMAMIFGLEYDKMNGTAQALPTPTPPLTARPFVQGARAMPNPTPSKKKMGRPRKLPPNDVLVALYRSGMSAGEIAEKYGTHPGTVGTMLRSIGEPMRSLSEAGAIREERGRTAKYWLGKKQPPEMVEKRVEPIRGENHYLWKGGDSRRGYRGKVRKDACAECGDKKSLCIHHADLDHYNNDRSNLVVLCTSCHMRLHRRAYWDAIHAGEQPPKSNGPVGWRRKGK